MLFIFGFLLAGWPPARNSEEKIQRALARWIFSESVPTHKSMKNQGVWGGFAPPAKNIFYIFFFSRLAIFRPDLPTAFWLYLYYTVDN